MAKIYITDACLLKKIDIARRLSKMTKKQLRALVITNFLPVEENELTELHDAMVRYLDQSTGKAYSNYAQFVDEFVNHFESGEINCGEYYLHHAGDNLPC